MSLTREIHPDFWNHLKYKDQGLIDLYIGLREFILSIHPKGNELLYHTHALTSLYSVSEKMSDAFCMIPIYTNHFNLGFNKGALLNDPDNLHNAWALNSQLNAGVPLLQHDERSHIGKYSQRLITLTHSVSRKPSGP